MVEGAGKKTLSKIVILGDMGVGKTTLLNSYIPMSNKKKASLGPDFR